jgi:hypothetical protein
VRIYIQVLFYPRETIISKENRASFAVVEIATPPSPTVHDTFLVSLLVFILYKWLVVALPELASHGGKELERAKSNDSKTGGLLLVFLFRAKQLL